jgi:hypothetical protein
MGIIRKRPDAALTTPYCGIDPLDLYQPDAPASHDPSAAPWPDVFTDWDGPLGDLPARIVQGVRAASPSRARHERPASLLARAAIDRALAVTREEYFEPTPDREGAVALVLQTCESGANIDGRLVHSLGSMLTQPTPELRRVPGCFRLHESFVKGPSGTFRECCAPMDIEAAIAQLIQTVNREKSLPPPWLAAWAYAQLCIVHPFANGNGRVARVLATMILLRRGWPPIWYVPFDNALLYSIFQQLFAQGAAVRGAAFARAFDEIHARSVANLTA